MTDIADTSLKNALWITDLLLDGMTDLHVTASALQEVAAGNATFEAHDAQGILEKVEGMTMGLGILQSALADLRLFVPAGNDTEKRLQK